MRKIIFLMLSCIAAYGLVNAMDQNLLHDTARWADFFDQMVFPLNTAEKIPLHEAVARGDLQRVVALLDKGANINLRDRNGYTSLYIAILNNHLEVIRFLLARGANVDLHDVHFKSALDSCDLYHGYHDCDKVVQLIKDHIIHKTRNEMFAFLNATHPRLGEKSPANEQDEWFFRYIFELLKEADQGAPDPFCGTPLEPTKKDSDHELAILMKGHQSRLTILRHQAWVSERQQALALAMALALHPRIGQYSPVNLIDASIIQKIFGFVNQ